MSYTNLFSYETFVRAISGAAVRIFDVVKKKKSELKVAFFQTKKHWHSKTAIFQHFNL